MVNMLCRRIYESGYTRTFRYDWLFYFPDWPILNAAVSGIGCPRRLQALGIVNLVDLPGVGKALPLVKTYRSSNLVFVP